MAPALVLVTLLSLALAGCSAGGDAADTRESGSAEAFAPAATEAVGDAAAGADAAAGIATGPASGVDPDVAAASAQRQVISTATVLVTVDHLDGSVEEARRIAEAADGLVFDEQTSREADPQTTLTLKVPPEAFDRVLDRLAALGDLESKQISTDDVTAQVVDLDSRIATAEASVERLRALIVRAEDVEDIAVLEAQLLDRETTLESLRGERRTIADQVALATVTVTLQPTPDSPDTPEDEPTALPGFLDALQGGWDALVRVLTVIGLVLVALLPWVPVALAVGFAARYGRRRYRRRHPQAAPPAPPGHPAPPPPPPPPPPVTTPAPAPVAGAPGPAPDEGHSLS